MKISINFFTYIFYILLILMGYINYLVIYLFILAIHELGHIITIKLFKYKINEIKIYPTGSIILTNISINIKQFQEFLISIAGILFQIILLFIIPKTNIYIYNIFYKINISLIIFNILPIYPLDGYKIFLSLIESFYKYRIIIYISYFISIISLIIFFNMTKNIYLFIFLYLVNIKYILNYKYYYNKFILERYLYKIRCKKTKYIKNINDLYKTKNNYIYLNGKYIEEGKLYDFMYKSIDKVV